MLAREKISPDIFVRPTLFIIKTFTFHFVVEDMKSDHEGIIY